MKTQELEDFRLKLISDLEDLESLLFLNRQIVLELLKNLTLPENPKRKSLWAYRPQEVGRIQELMLKYSRRSNFQQEISQSYLYRISELIQSSRIERTLKLKIDWYFDNHKTKILPVSSKLGLIRDSNSTRPEGKVSRRKSEHEG